MAHRHSDNHRRCLADDAQGVERCCYETHCVTRRPGEPALVGDWPADAGLAALQGAVGGPIELVVIPDPSGEDPDGLDLWAHEEGLLIGLPPNVQPPGAQVLVGTVLVTGHDADGNTVGLTGRQAQAVRRLLDAWAVDPEGPSPEPEVRVIAW